MKSKSITLPYSSLVIGLCLILSSLIHVGLIVLLSLSFEFQPTNVARQYLPIRLIRTRPISQDPDQAAFLAQQSSTGKVEPQQDHANQQAANNLENLIDQSMQDISLNQDEKNKIQSLEKEFNSQPGHKKKKFISSATKEYIYARYMENWRRCIEATATSNYPEEARKNNIQGRIQLSVSIDRQGNLVDIQMNQSSGISILDTAAENSVHLCNPYPPFPDNFPKDLDILVITRTWVYQIK